jgi:type VI secretion system protein ImpH
VATQGGTQDFDVTTESGAGAPAAAEPSAPARPEILDALEREPFCFDFFQAVRLLERLTPQREPVGRFVNPAREVVHFGAHPSVSFPPSQLHSITGKTGEPARMTVNFMGLTGPLGVLPHYYTELVITRVRAKDYALRDFFDIFNHRVIALFYQAWQKYRFTVAYERGERDRFSHHLLDLVGLGTEGLQNRQAVADDSLIYYAGLLAQWPRSACALRQVLTDYFNVPVEIEQFAGGWFKLDKETQCCFEDGNTFSEQLGVGAVVGDEIWDQQSSVRVKLGPLTLTEYRDFLPNGTAFTPLRGLLGFFAGAEFDFEVQLILKREQVPACELGAEDVVAPHLGWVTWMKTAPFGRDPADTVLPVT